MSVTKRILINAANEMDEIRVAITSDRQLVDLDIERIDSQQTKANIYKAKISRIEPSLDAVFVDYGAERHGFLPFKEISPEYFLKKPSAKDESPKLTDSLKVGQDLVIQVEKEERGSKGAALTTFISLAGSYLVLMPNNPSAGGISRRIDQEGRDQLRDLIDQLQIPKGMGVIIRTASVDKSIDELQWDLDFLLQYWEAIKKAAIEKPGPYLIHQESDAVMRALRDHLRKDIAEIVIDLTEAFNRAKQYIQTIRPDFAERVKLYDNSTPIFSYYQIERQIEQAYDSKIYLPSGGSVVIHPTEALVSIDVNSAHATKGKDIEETALNTNLEAAEEILKQLRLRDIGGLIVIDFIDMTPLKHQREVENALKEAAKTDRARIRIGRISQFGLLEMSRQRLRSSLNRTIQVTCPRCHGQGKIRTVQSLSNSIIHILQEQSAKSTNVHFETQVPIEVATFLTNEQRDLITHIEKLHDVKITIIPNPQLQTPNHYIKQVRMDSSRKSQDIQSHHLIEKPKPLSAIHMQPKQRSRTEPVVKQFLADNFNKKPHRSTTKKKGALKKFLAAVFGGTAEQKPEKPTEPQRRRSNQHNRRRTSSTKSRYHRRRPPQRSRNNRSPSGNRRRPSNNRRYNDGNRNKS
jgi:ribonuclease E